MLLGKSLEETSVLLSKRFQTLKIMYKETEHKCSLFFIQISLSQVSGGASGKEPTCQCRRRKRWGFRPSVGKIPWGWKWQPTPVFLPGESHGQRSLAGYSPWGRKSCTWLKQLSTPAHVFLRDWFCIFKSYQYILLMDTDYLSRCQRHTLLVWKESLFL